MLKRIAIAIDGPAASGKSTTAKLVALRLGYMHIDTGAMYRALTLEVLRRKISPDDEAGVRKLARKSRVRLEQGKHGNRVLLNDEDVSAEIRTPKVTRAVSAVSSFPFVRALMVHEQRKMGAHGGIVLEGRDIGTVVLPKADLKIFMVASVTERARRRKKDLALVGEEVDEHELEQEIAERDRKDSTREASPLKKAVDALELDTTNVTIEEQVEFIVKKANEIIQK